MDKTGQLNLQKVSVNGILAVNKLPEHRIFKKMENIKEILDIMNEVKGSNVCLPDSSLGNSEKKY